MNEDMEKFKQDYPGMYERFLKMNNALAGIQKVLREREQGNLPHGRDVTTGLYQNDLDELPNMLELD